MTRILIVLISCCTLNSTVVGQSPGLIFGTVTDAITKEPLPHANIGVAGTTIGTVTDLRGKFRMIIHPGDYILQFSFIGYKLQRVNAVLREGDSLHFDIRLAATTLLLGEVTVVAANEPVTAVHGLGGFALAPGKVENLAGGLGDIAKVIQTLPGVTSNNEMSSQFNVRGGAMLENLILLNGVEVLEPFHLKESPNTSLSVFNPSLLKRIFFSPGGFPARYGDRLSAVLDLEYREGNKERLAGQIDASLSDGSIIVEGPLGSHGSGLLNVRSTYSEYVAKYLVDGNQRTPSFYDIHGNVGLDVLPSHHLTLQALHSADETEGVTQGHYESTLLAVNTTSHLSPTALLRGTISTYRQAENLARGESPSWVGTRRSSNDDFIIAHYNVQSWIALQLSHSYSLTLGIDLQQYQYDLARRELISADMQGSLATSLLKVDSYKSATYAENLIHLGDHVIINAGIRLDHSALTRETVISPRFLAAYKFSDETTIKAAWGLYHQTPTYRQLFAAAAIQNPPQQVQRATHYIVGLERPLRGGFYFRVEAYFKSIQNLISFERLRSGELVFSPSNGASGDIRGVDFETSFRDERLMGWMNFSIMEAKELIKGLEQGWQFRPTDQSRTLSAVFEFKIDTSWLLNLRSFYGSGFAYTTDVPNLPPWHPDRRFHYPEYKRIDVRVNYKFSLQSAAVTTFAEITNLFGFKNAFSFTGSREEGGIIPDQNLLLPFIINCGMKVKL